MVLLVMTAEPIQMDIDLMIYTTHTEPDQSLYLHSQVMICADQLITNKMCGQLRFYA